MNANQKAVAQRMINALETGWYGRGSNARIMCQQAANLLRTLAAEPEAQAEPVTRGMVPNQVHLPSGFEDEMHAAAHNESNRDWRDWLRGARWAVRNLCTHPPKAEPAPEPKRTLTNEEIALAVRPLYENDLIANMCLEMDIATARAILAAQEKKENK